MFLGFEVEFGFVVCGLGLRFWIYGFGFWCLEFGFVVWGLGLWF